MSDAAALAEHRRRRQRRETTAKLMILSEGRPDDARTSGRCAPGLQSSLTDTRTLSSGHLEASANIRTVIDVQEARAAIASSLGEGPESAPPASGIRSPGSEAGERGGRSTPARMDRIGYWSGAGPAERAAAACGVGCGLRTGPPANKRRSRRVAPQRRWPTARMRVPGLKT